MQQGCAVSRRTIRAFAAYLRAQGYQSLDEFRRAHGQPVPPRVNIGVRCWRPKPEPANDAEPVPENDASETGPLG